MYQITDWTAWSDIMDELRAQGFSRIGAERALRAAVTLGEVETYCPHEKDDAYLVRTVQKSPEPLKAISQVDRAFDVDLDIDIDEEFIDRIEAIIDGSYEPVTDVISLFGGKK